MRTNFYIIIVSILVLHCSSSKSTFDSNEIFPIYNEGIIPLSESGFPFDLSSQKGVAKLYKGNTYSTNGVFISDEGLFLTNYSSIIDFIASYTNGDESPFKKGYIATSKELELPLNGLSLFIEIEQTDVTAKVKKEITDLSPNAEIYQSIQTQKTLLINERRGNDNSLHVEILDSYSGNKHIMNVYKIIRDVRLVVAPSVDLDLNTLTNSQSLLSKITGEYALLRAYSNSGETSTNTELENTPFSPSYFFPISRKSAEKSSTLTAFGFPGTTYRLETARAIHFYYTELNPTIISSHKIYLAKEDTLSATNNMYALRTVPRRFNLAQNIDFFSTVQSVLKENDVISVKEAQEKEFLAWIKADTTIPESYSNLFYYIDQAFDIAEQTSDAYFTTFYFKNVSLLDDLSAIYEKFLDDTKELESEEAFQLAKQTTLQNHEKLLSQINVGAELFMLKRFITNLAYVKETQQPLIIYDLFDGASTSDFYDISSKFVDENASSSFLFNIQTATNVLNDQTYYDDPLFSLLDEISFTLEMSQQSYALHYPFLFPAQEILTRTKLKNKEIKADAIGVTSFNIGSLNTHLTTDSVYFYTTNDFSGKAHGNAILDDEGNLMGLVSDENNTSILGNYMYKKENSYLKALRLSYILNTLASNPDYNSIIKEITQEK